MKKTIDLLVESCMADEFAPCPLIADYFGWVNQLFCRRVAQPRADTVQWPC
jgi:hypothetical protein